MTRAELTLKPKLTREFLQVLAEAVEVVGYDVDFAETSSLYENLCFLAQIPARHLQAKEDSDEAESRQQ